ncbi:cation transport ATPase [Longilinea arvoryzae]|uniref:Cation transport ATPase n=1 Tax=Longilinea arvoryzae TaxID=360412 RepID=A0A0S7BP49_9CHLR|nr:cation-transporting P-type ATPase [Longilinea arvoryzae]GAP15713.1 cation transport ATPase [Longilinea arvoryzae]
MIEHPLTNDFPWHTASVDETIARLQTNQTNGLTDPEAGRRLTQAGPNTLAVERPESFWHEFFEELHEPMVLMLLVTGVLYAIWGEVSEAITIFVIILTLNTVEVTNEQRSKRAIASLRKLAEPTASVRRGGHFTELPVDQIVPGDVILLQDGRRVPADAHLVEVYSLSVDESALTGESLPVEKSAAFIANPETPLADRQNMVYSSTLVSRGKGWAVVVATGMSTEIGRIAGMAREVREPRTPLQNMMEELSKILVWFALGFSILVPLVGILLAHQPPKQMLLTGLSLAFATIPEEMPIIITMVLSLGAFRLSKKHAIARRLNAVESLGSVTVIATDKTGTLTENRMAVTRFEPAGAKERLLEIGVFCNDAVPDGMDFRGDAVDTALLRAAQTAGMDVSASRKARPIVAEFPFDNNRKCMSTVTRKDDHAWVAVKGAPESILPQCILKLDGKKVVSFDTAAKQAVLDCVDGMAADGLRVLALAERTLDAENLDLEIVESGLAFIGLVGLQDPPRPEVRQAIATCRRAGVRAIMITGDHPLTARAIARQVGLDGDFGVVTGPELDQLSDRELKETVRRVSIFARATPEHKLRIVQALQALGERVAVTGDGVNDAPALAAADIGVAMGETGTDVAREAGDLVLADDNFTTILHAVEEGRLIFENLKKGVRYYLACKVALIMINLLPTLLLVPVPFAPVQIILMELFMDLMAAASFVVEGPESDLLERKPRDPKAKFMDGAMIGGILTSALGLFIAITTVYLVTWYNTHDIAVSQTTAFFGWLIGHVLLAFNLRSERQPVFQAGLSSNRMMLAWAGAVAVFLLLVSVIPGARQLMKAAPLTGSQWSMILIATFIGTFWMEVKKRITFKK